MSKAGLYVTTTAMALLSLFWTARSYLIKPERRDFVGVYRNDCCSDIIVRDRLVYGNKAFPYDLVRMKFGVTAYIHARLTPTEGISAAEPTAMIFSGHNNELKLTALIDGQPYQFSRVRDGASLNQQK